jgi:aerobic-type carbon monoxide dehydrogenase small subunit (CoxS/CutS family)
MKETVRFKLNGKTTSVTLDTDRKLLWALRTDLGLTGTKYGCGESYCGACTVIVDNAAVRSCQTTVKEIRDKEIITIEGLEQTGALHPLQKAFAQHGAFQCGYCTSGMVMNAYALLREHRRPSNTDIVDGMEGNLCRCGAHTRIMQAIQTAAKELEGGTKS